MWELGKLEIQDHSALLKKTHVPCLKTPKRGQKEKLNSKLTMKQKKKLSCATLNIMTVTCGNWMLTLRSDKPVITRQDHVAPRSALMKVIYVWDMLYEKHSEMPNYRPSLTRQTWPVCYFGRALILALHAYSVFKVSKLPVSLPIMRDWANRWGKGCLFPTPI